MTTPVQSAALGVINDKLQTGWFNPVTHADIKTVTDTLSKLNGPDAHAVIADLKAHGKLDQIAAETVDGSVAGLGGLSTTERAAFFSNMAGKLDGADLATLARAFGTSDSNHGAPYVEELGKAVATHASPDAKVQFINQLKGATADQSARVTNSLGSSTSVEGDADAVAIGEVLGSLRGAHAERALALLNPAELKAVLAASIDTTSRTSSVGEGGTMQSLAWNASSFNQIMRAGASIGDAHTKAQLFNAGAETMRTVEATSQFIPGTAVIGRGAALGKMAAGLTKVLDSDTSGVMRDLAYNSQTRGGAAMSLYAKVMLSADGAAAGGKAQLGATLAKLQLGNSLNENAYDRLNRTFPAPLSGQSVRQNAGALGYFVGSVYNGADSISKDVKAQQEMITTLLKTGLTLVDKAKVGGLAGQVTASTAKEWVQFAVRGAISDPGRSAAQMLERAALPVDPATNQLTVGDDVRNAFNTALTTTQRLN